MIASGTAETATPGLSNALRRSPADQAWFLSPEWKFKVSEAQEHVRDGNETEFADVDESVSFLDTMITE